MKRLHEQVSLKKRLEQITISDFRSRPGEVLQSVGLGKAFVITKAGKPIAVLSKVPGETLAQHVQKDGVVKFKLES